MVLPRWEWLGGGLAVDLLCTAHPQADGTYQEYVESAGDLEAWRGLVDRSLPSATGVTASGLARFRRLRDAGLRLAEASAAGQELPQRAVDTVNRAARSTALVPQIGAPARYTSAEGGLDALLGRCAVALVELFDGDRRERLAICGAPGCGWWYERQRPNQRWCDPACGNRARVHRHRQRTS